MNKTAVFSGQMNQIVFSPYWMCQQVFWEKNYHIAKNSNYLANTTWNGWDVALDKGQACKMHWVKWNSFPNSYYFYAWYAIKSLFDREQRAFSHGCIRLARPRDLAIEILKDDKNWTAEKIDIAMNRRVERTYNLKPKYPCTLVILRVDSDGQIHFYKDIYGHDERLSKILLSDLKKANPFHN
jgi:murein L,D-transpeptidase YcbB/YkuD